MAQPPTESEATPQPLPASEQPTNPPAPSNVEQAPEAAAGVAEAQAKAKAQGPNGKEATREVNPFVGLDDDEVDGEGFDYVISETVDGPAADESKEGEGDVGGDMEDIGKEGEGLEGDAAEGEGDVAGNKGPTLGYSHGFGGASKVSKEVDEAMREFNVTTTNYAGYSNDLGRRHTPFEIDLGMCMT